MEFRILGPLEGLAGGKRLVLGRTRERRVLAALLLDADRVVPVDRLVDMVWDDHPPASATKLVRNCVSTLRRRMAEIGSNGDVIVTDPAGYALRIGPGRLDAQVFRSGVAEARQLASTGQLGPAVERLRAALALWHGPALAGMTGRAIEVAATGLNEERVSALEECLSHELTLGKGHELVAELHALVAQHPLRERLRGQLMLALYRSGRRSDALDVYRAGRRILIDELGLEPGSGLRKLEQQILNDDPGLAAGRPVQPAVRPAPARLAPAQLPADVTSFTGRTGHLAALDDVLSDRAGDRPTAVVISAIDGTAGVGKTALAVHWAHRVRSRFPDGQLYVNLRGYAPDPSMRPLEALAMFLRALGVPADQVPVEVVEAAALYRSMLADRRVLIVLDNASSPQQVRPLLPGSPDCLVLVTSRDTLAGLAAREGAWRVSLDVLTPAEAGALLARVIGEPRVAAEPEAARELARACAHLPLALRIAAAHITGHPGRGIAGYLTELDAGGRLAGLAADGDEEAAVRVAFDLSYAALSPDLQRMFRRLGLVPGPDVTAEAVAALTGDTPQDASRGLSRLADAHLLEEHRPGRFTFHDLLRRYAAERARAEDGAAGCRAATDRLLEHYRRYADAAARTVYPEILRVPAPASGDPQPTPAADPPAALDPAALDPAALDPAALDPPGAGLAWLDAERPNLVAAITQAAAGGPRAAAWLLSDALRGYFHLRMHTVDWLAVGRAGLAAGEADGSLAGQAAARLSLGDLHWRLSRYPEAIEHYTEAAALAVRAHWPAAQIAINGNLGNVYQQSGRLDEAAERYRRALAIAERTGWVRGQAANLENLGAVYWELGRLAEAVDHGTRALGILRETGSRFAEGVDLTGLGEMYHALGRFEDAADQLDRALTLHRDVGNRGGEAETLRILALLHRDTGRFGEALDLAQEALALARDAGDRRYEADALNTVATVLRLLGFPEEAVGEHQAALVLAQEIGNRYPEVEALIGLAVAYRQLGYLDQALTCAHDGAALARRVGYRILEGQALTVLADLELRAGQPDEARRHSQQAAGIRRETGHRDGPSLRPHLVRIEEKRVASPAQPPEPAVAVRHERA